MTLSTSADSAEFKVSSTVLVNPEVTPVVILVSAPDRNVPMSSKILVSVSVPLELAAEDPPSIDGIVADAITEETLDGIAEASDVMTDAIAEVTDDASEPRVEVTPPAADVILATIPVVLVGRRPKGSSGLNFATTATEVSVVGSKSMRFCPS